MGIDSKVNFFIVDVMYISVKSSYYFNFKTLHFHVRENIMIKFGSIFFRDLFE